MHTGDSHAASFAKERSIRSHRLSFILLVNEESIYLRRQPSLDARFIRNRPCAIRSISLGLSSVSMRTASPSVLVRIMESDLVHVLLCGNGRWTAAQRHVLGGPAPVPISKPNLTAIGK